MSQSRPDWPQQPRQVPGVQVSVWSHRLSLLEELQQGSETQVPMLSLWLELPQEMQQALGMQSLRQHRRLGSHHEAPVIGPLGSTMNVDPVGSELQQEICQAPSFQAAARSSSLLDFSQALIQAPGFQAADPLVSSGTTPERQSNLSPSASSAESHGAQHSRDRSENSSIIDRIPHRPPRPSEDFEAYSRYIANLSPEEYDRMFHIPLVPGETNDGWDSDVDSNERYVQSFNYDMSDSDADPPSRYNTNNTIGSRERAQECLRQQVEAYRNYARQSAIHQVLPGTQTAVFGDDEVEAEVHGVRRRRGLNNALEQAASSGDILQRPPRSATVPPPPLSHRVPRLEEQTEADRARHREMFRLFQTGAIRQPSSSESRPGESTDSGEYTVRDGSLPSSGGYNGHLEQSQQSSSSSSASSQRARAALTVALVASTLSSTEGSSDLVINGSEWDHETYYTSASMYVLLGSIAIIVWLLGFLCAKCQTSFCTRHITARNQPQPQDVANQIVIHVGSSLAVLPSSVSATEPRQPRRRTHRGTAVYTTSAGDCVHLARDCQTLRGCKVVTQKHLCTCCFPMSTISSPVPAVPPGNT